MLTNRKKTRSNHASGRAAQPPPAPAPAPAPDKLMQPMPVCRKCGGELQLREMAELIYHPVGWYAIEKRTAVVLVAIDHDDSVSEFTGEIEEATLVCAGCGKVADEVDGRPWVHEHAPDGAYDTRQGCSQKVCWCHIDPQPVGWTCSSCGCVVVGEEGNAAPTAGKGDGRG